MGEASLLSHTTGGVVTRYIIFTGQMSYMPICVHLSSTGNATLH